jgi:phage gp36-like protein
MAAWADSTDMVKRYDNRVLSQLVTDSGNRDMDFAVNTRLTMALNTATGRMQASFLFGGRYTVSQIDSLTGETLEFRKDICCALSWWILWRSKPWLEATSEAQRAAREDAEAYIELIKSGAAIFNIEAVVEAGKAEVTPLPRRTVDNEWSLVRDRLTGNLYPVRRSTRNV